MQRYLKKSDQKTLLGEMQEKAKKNNEGVDPFRVLIGTVLSIRNRDESTVIATSNLFDKKRLNTPQKIEDTPISEIEDLIRKSGMYKTKAQRIKEISRILIDNFDGQVPDTMEQLLLLPGVGPKVANCVLVYAFKKPAIPVDTHVHRISNRTGLVTTKNPEDTEEILKKIYPKDYWLEVNDIFVKFGKSVCKPIGPKCNECPITQECPKIIIKKSSKKSKGSSPILKK
ncbi:MAG: endonuclease III [Candidatus Lokiarchaeota archaeon]|nr:endonuclease III [Candidatus Lokiarchaeota archaeon]